MQWYLMVMRDNYANFSGRARRKEYWMFTLFFMLFLLVPSFVFGLLIGMFPSDKVLISGGIILAAIYFIHLVPGLAVTVRRLHDTGKSGWLYLLVIIPYIGSLIIFIFTVIEGDKGDNKYGPDPKA